MGKITFRADDALVDELEAFDASKSEVMREALRSYLESRDRGDGRATGAASGGRNGTASAPADRRTDRAPIDDLVRETVDDLLDRRGFARGGRPGEQRDVNVTISLEGVGERARGAAREPTAGGPDRERKTDASDAGATDGPPARTDPGSEGSADTGPGRRCSRCGESVDGDHVYCPNCGEKASRRVFCDCGDEVRSDWSFCPGCGRRTPAADVLESG